MKKTLRGLADRYRALPKDFRLKDWDPGDTAGLDLGKKGAEELLAKGIQSLADLQRRLYADHEWSVLLLFQAPDAAGKDSAIKHVFSGVNPQGCRVVSFKEPSAKELSHDFLWRCEQELPERGQIGIFNRSYYEEVLVVRVHPELLEKERIPRELSGKSLWQQRYESINEFERHLSRNGTRLLKFYLNVSQEEQRKRFLERLEKPDKNWKFSERDLTERALWKKYQKAYEDAIRATSTEDAPWYVVPADHKWFTWLVISEVIISALEKLNLHYPKINGGRRRELAKIRKALEEEG
ncbi:MAG TPA: polyphosphate kinase 2 family protein [Thermoanaerobaculia bacterium]|nr:polyphosphate kinase 2 family protein [Thermoanaerobaculia bacterium]